MNPSVGCEMNPYLPGQTLTENTWPKYKLNMQHTNLYLSWEKRLRRKTPDPNVRKIQLYMQNESFPSWHISWEEQEPNLMLRQIQPVRSTVTVSTWTLDPCIIQIPHDAKWTFTFLGTQAEQLKQLTLYLGVQFYDLTASCRVLVTWVDLKYKVIQTLNNELNLKIATHTHFEFFLFYKKKF